MVDSLVGFLQSPVWSFPVEAFTEESCIVFDRGGDDRGGDNEQVYKHVYSKYKTMVEKLVETFLSELGITEQQLTEACAKSKKLGIGHEGLLRPLLASADYEAFKSLMVQKNIALELQALELLQKQLGQLDVYHGQAKVSPTPQQRLAKRDADEEEALQNALKLSKRESELMLMADDQEMEKLLELAIRESLKLQQREKQDEPMRKGSGEKETKPCAEHTSLGGESKIAEDGQIAEDGKIAEDEPSRLLPLTAGVGGASVALLGRELSGEQAAKLWIQSAKSELEIRQSSPLVKQRSSLSKAKGLPDELEARERYLKRQRDKLIESKKIARAEQLKLYKESKISSSRPCPPLNRTHSQLRPGSSTTEDSELVQPIREGNCAQRESGNKPAPKSSSSGVLCSVIARKLREEQTT